jgi:hypothetical protein
MSVRHEREARLANGFDKRPVGAGGVVISTKMRGPDGGFTQAALREAYEVGRKERR